VPLSPRRRCARAVERDINGGDCSWPDQLDKIGPGTNLVVLTEQYLLLNPLLLRDIRARAGSRRSLVILDEALFTTTAVVRRFTRSDLQGFRSALAETRQNGASDPGVEAWLEGIDFLLDREVELATLRRFWSNRLNRSVLAAQMAGHQAFGSAFRYLATELELLNSAVTTGQWRDGDTFEIVVRVDTIGCDVVIMAPYLDAEIVEERLSRPVIKLFSNLVFRHSESRIINIADPIGTATTLAQPAHFNRVVDFFLALILRNVTQGRRTVLVIRKKFLNRVKARVEQVSAAIGRPLTCVLASSGKPFERCGPTEVALINYGIVGVNSLKPLTPFIASEAITPAPTISTRSTSRPCHRTAGCRLGSAWKIAVGRSMPPMARSIRGSTQSGQARPIGCSNAGSCSRPSGASARSRLGPK
jgi:hypothetical protein